MQILGALLSAVITLFETPITLYGITFSYWQVYCFIITSGILAWVLSEWFLGD